jgi:hypothetical protein
MVAGQEFVNQIIDSIPGKSQWILPLPPNDGEKPRILTIDEKDKLLNIASAVPQVFEAKVKKDVINTGTQYEWVGWNGNSDGESYLNYEGIEKGTASQSRLSSMGDKCYPAVEFVFNSRYGECGKAGIDVAVNLETGRVVYLGGFNSSSPMPQKLPPIWYQSSSEVCPKWRYEVGCQKWTPNLSCCK